MDSLAKKRPTSAYLKFFILPLIGIAAFFIDVPFTGYTVMGYTVAATSTIPINHLTNFLRALLWSGDLKVMPYVVLAISAYGLADLIIRRKKHFGNTLGVVFSIIKCIGVVFIVFAVFKIGPSFMHEPHEMLAAKSVVDGVEVFTPRSISAFVLNGVLITISISIPLAAVFLPFLLNYGLVEFIGVLVRPIMRPLFRLPGRSAVIMLTALLGNFSVAHIAVDEEYHRGQMTEREAMAICTGFCSSSVAFMLVLANNSGISDRWNAYFWSCFLIIMMITVIGVRVPPISRVRNGYLEGITPQPESVYKEKLLKNAFREAMDVSEAADNPAKTISHILKATALVLAAIIMGAGFSTSAGMLLYMYTPIFEWLGVIFRPIMWLLQIPSNEVNVAATGAAFSLLEVTIPSMLVMSGEWSIHVRYMMAVVPITSVIFLGSYVPSLISTNLPVKFWHLMVVWLERMILSVLFSGIFALILFGIPG